MRVMTPVVQPQPRIEPVAEADAAHQRAEVQVEGVADEGDRHHDRRAQRVAGVAAPEQVEGAVEQVARRGQADGSQQRRRGQVAQRLPARRPSRCARLRDQQPGTSGEEQPAQPTRLSQGHQGRAGRWRRLRRVTAGARRGRSCCRWRSAPARQVSASSPSLAWPPACASSCATPLQPRRVARQPAGPAAGTSAPGGRRRSCAPAASRSSRSRSSAVDLLAAVPHQLRRAARTACCVEAAVAHDHVGLEVERQAQRVEVARADGAPLVVHQRHLAVQRPLAVFVDAHAGVQQVVVQHAGRRLDDRHVGLALQDQAHVDAAPRRAAQLADAAGSRERSRRWR